MKLGQFEKSFSRKLINVRAETYLKNHPGVDPQQLRNFGICGDCETIGKNGQVKLRDVRAGDKLISRDRGYSSVSYILKIAAQQERLFWRATTVKQGAFDGKLPQSDVKLGGSNVVSYYYQKQGERRPTLARKLLEELVPGVIERGAVVELLCIPVFKVPTEIYMSGVYVHCPSEEEILVRG